MGSGCRESSFGRPRLVLFTKMGYMFKRLFDITAAFAALVFLSPVIAVVAWQINRQMGVPVLFRQARPGLNGKPFEMIKFRTMLMEYLPLYSAEQCRRHDVRPGITGWAQINGRNALSWEEKFKLDVWYVDNRSFWLDIKILFLTVKKVLVRDGISAEGEATMSKFTGQEK